MSQPLPFKSPLSVVFLLHIALDVPVAIQGLWSPAALPFLQLNNTALVFVKLYAALAAAGCVAALLTWGLPEILPGKRALALALCFYHVTCSTILYHAPRIIPYTLGPLAEAWKVTPELVWGTMHGVVGLGFLVWWQATVHMAAQARRAH